MAGPHRGENRTASTLIREAEATLAPTSSPQSPSKSVWGRADKAAFNFLVADSELGITFTRIATDAEEGCEKWTRNRAKGRAAYDAVSRLSRSASLTDQERRKLELNLNELRSALERLGEVFN